MRKIFSALVLTLVTANASALNTETKDLLATIAMPLAVAAVSRVTGVPQTELSNLVSTLNQANVPPAQFVDVMRYTPVALTDNNGQPFVGYVQTQASQGLTGDALVNAIVQQLRSRYNVTPQATTYFVDDNYIPNTTFTPLVRDSGGTLAESSLDVIALPLAVAAVADVAGVPQDQLATLIATLNNANVPPAQIIEVVRYVPVALVDDPQPFVQYVQQQASQGITGPALYPVIVRRLQPYYPTTTINVAPRTSPLPAVIATAKPFRAQPPRQAIVVDENFLPRVVVTRTAEVRDHPHPRGGPPGQVKKQLGLQTGAEVVHAQQPGEERHGRGRGHEAERTVVVQQPAPPVVAAPAAPPQAIAPPAVVGKGHGNGRGPEGAGPPGQNKEKEHGKGKGKDQP